VISNFSDDADSNKDKIMKIKQQLLTQFENSLKKKAKQAKSEESKFAYFSSSLQAIINNFHLTINDVSFSLLSNVISNMLT